jgi:hypothetical protein
MKNFLLPVVFLFVGVIFAEAEPLVLSDGGRSDYVIVVGESASPSERYAAEELQRFLKEISGSELPLSTDKGQMTSHEILVGNSLHVEELDQPIDWKKLGDEGFVMRVAGNHLILAGGKVRGTLYAVYAFLDEVLGCRWFAPDASRIPKQEKVQVDPIAVTFIPTFEYRAVGWHPASDADWAARNRVNTGAPLQEKHGGTLSVVGGVHNFHTLLPPARYAEKHPEYYSEINGRRTWHKTQICLTNPEVVDIIAEEIKRMLSENPNAKLVGLGQEDSGGWCDCKDCQAICQREGSRAGVLIQFLNQVAERIEQQYPEASLITLAYQDTRKPPKTIKPRHNVIPWVCGIECCYSHPIATCETNRSFEADLEGWAALTDRVYIFDYTANFEHYVMPHPNLRVLQPNFQLFAKNHAKGVYGTGNGGAGSELAYLRGYLIAKLLWKPDTDVEEVRREFLEAYYGKAAEPLEQYLQLMHDKVEKDNIHASIVAGPRMPYLVPEMIAKAKALFDKAESLAENETILERVRAARLPIQHVELEWAKPAYHFQNGVYKPSLAPGTEKLAEDFAKVAERNGVTQIYELHGAVPPSWHLKQQAVWKQEWPAGRLENDCLRVDVVPGWGGRIVSLYHKGKDVELLLPPQPDGREFPRSGGYEEYSERGWRSHGCQDVYEFEEEIPGRHVRMWAELPNGLKMERTLELAATGGVLTIHSRLINVSNEPKAACLRGNPKFQMGPTEQVEVAFTTIGKKQRSISLITGPGKSRDSLILKGAERPDGVWQAANPRLGLTLKQHFDPREVEECALDWLPPRGRFFMELQTPEKTLAPGEEITLTQRFEVQPCP